MSDDGDGHQVRLGARIGEEDPVDRRKRPQEKGVMVQHRSGVASDAGLSAT